MARTLTDAVICLGALTGTDPADSKTLLSAGHSLTDYTKFLVKDALKGKRIGLVTTATIYDATPAAFSIHAKSRRDSAIVTFR